jgi:polysaccharide biosynthesis/export protein
LHRMHKPIAKVATFIIFISVAFLLGSCNNRSIMFKTGMKYEFDDMSQMTVIQQYKIGVNDELSVQVSPNNGSSLLEASSNSTNVTGQLGYTTSIVDYDGTLKLPVLGSVNVLGLTNREAELLLEERYRSYFVNPFVKVQVTNKRVILFPGESGSARVVNLRNQNTTLLEALASSGGIPANGKAHKVKLIRKDETGITRIYLIDLSKINGLYSANTVLQGNDIVYVEPRNDYLLNFASRSAGYFFVFNTLLLLNSLLK